jgi:hypothetical protein
MELPVLANLKRNTLRGIASLTERPSKNKAERSEAKTPGAGFPRPKGQAVGDGGAGTTPPETAAAASVQQSVMSNTRPRGVSSRKATGAGRQSTEGYLA